MTSATGGTVFDAARNRATQVSRHIYWGHCVVLIIGEKAARQGIRKNLGFFLRSPQPRETMWVMVAKGEAKNLLMAQPGLEKTSAQAIGFLARSKAGYSVNLKDLTIMLASIGNEPIASRIEVIKTVSTPYAGQQIPVEEVQLTGTAAFKDDKLVGWLDERETRGLLWLRGEVGKGVITIPFPGKPEYNLSLDMIRASSKIIPEYQNGRVSFTVKLILEGDLEEGQGQTNVADPSFIPAVEKELEKDVKKRADLALHRAQVDFKSDIFGFGDTFHRSYKNEWKQLKGNWNEVFTKAEVRISVKAFVRRSGLLSNAATKRE